jgi:hypothetical protein
LLAAAAFFEGMLLHRSTNELRPRRQTGEPNKFRDERESKQKLPDHDVLASAARSRRIDDGLESICHETASSYVIIEQRRRIFGWLSLLKDLSAGVTSWIRYRTRDDGGTRGCGAQSQGYREHFKRLAVQLDRRTAMTRASFTELARTLAQARGLASEPNDQLTQLRLIELIRDI